MSRTALVGPWRCASRRCGLRDGTLVVNPVEPRTHASEAKSGLPAFVLPAFVPAFGRVRCSAKGWLLKIGCPGHCFRGHCFPGIGLARALAGHSGAAPQCSRQQRGREPERIGCHCRVHGRVVATASRHSSLSNPFENGDVRIVHRVVPVPSAVSRGVCIAQFNPIPPCREEERPQSGASGSRPT